MIKAIFALALAAAAPAAGFAQEDRSTLKDAGEVVSQPGRDVGIDKAKVPPLLAAAQDDPYSTVDTRSCPQLTGAIRALNEELGPDYGDTPARGDSKLKKGSAAVVNMLVPFRGIVREVSGAAPADRRLAAAVQAGVARRGFLRGVYTQRACRTGM